MNAWDGVLEDDKEPKDEGLIFKDAIEVYFEELLWQKIDAESFALESDDEEIDLEECDRDEVLEQLEDELTSAMNYHESRDVREFAEKVLAYVNRLKEFEDE